MATFALVVVAVIGAVWIVSALVAAALLLAARLGSPSVVMDDPWERLEPNRGVRPVNHGPAPSSTRVADTQQAARRDFGSADLRQAPAPRIPRPRRAA